jgi:hypothetical protein
MSFEERIERLTERHEALTQSIELMQHDWQTHQAEWEARWTKIAAAIQQDGENIRALARIAEIHERRLTHLEEGGDRSQ